MRALLFVIPFVALSTACITSKPTTAPTATTSVQEQIAALGDKVTTGAGNQVAVFSYLSPVQGARMPDAGKVFAAVDVEACAGPNAAANTGVSRSQFALETPDKTGWPSVAPVKEPALKNTVLKPKQCERGWISFQLPSGQKPQFVVLLSSNVVKWRVT